VAGDRHRLGARTLHALRLSPRARITEQPADTPTDPGIDSLHGVAEPKVRLSHHPPDVIPVDAIEVRRSNGKGRLEFSAFGCVVDGRLPNAIEVEIVEPNYLGFAAIADIL
jgi:hypothetical protein